VGDALDALLRTALLEPIAEWEWATSELPTYAP
jgi:hypothetical protein